jgi:type II secretory pathway pseudopilin PulG
MIQKNTSGFTLIQISIAFVIIGLICIFVGQNLIHASSGQAQITQSEKKP